MEAPSLHSSDSQSITVQWIPVENANSYTLQYRNSISSDGHPSDWVPLPAITGNIIRKKNLNPDGLYCFRVIPNLNEVSDRWAFSPPSDGFSVCQFPLYTKNLLGMKLIDAAGNQILAESLAGYTLGIYASASWCGPCRQFTPSLIGFYNEARASGRKFQIIFVSCDRDKQSFDSYFSKMPWFAIPFESEARENALKEMQVVAKLWPFIKPWIMCLIGLFFQVQGIPRLMILNAEGRTAEVNAVQSRLTLGQLDAWSSGSACVAQAQSTPASKCCGGGCGK